VLADPGVHGDPGGHPGVDRPGGAELRDGDGQRGPFAGCGGEAGALLPEQQQAAPRQARGLQPLRAGSVVHRHHGEILRGGVAEQPADVVVVSSAIKRDNPRYWVWFGVVAGLGMEEKYTIALFGLGIVVGLLLTAQRRAFLNPWIWLGGLAAFLVFLPNLLWNIHYDWPFVQLMHNIRAEGRDVVLGPVDYFAQQLLLVNPFAEPIWLTGLFALLFSQRLRPYRFLGWSYLVCYGVLFALHGKNYYLAPIYPMLLAAGAVVIDEAISRKNFAWLKPVIAILLLANGAYLTPIVVPVLSPDGFLNYANYLPMKLPVMEHDHARAALPQWYSDQFGWNEIVAETAVAWNRLSDEERQNENCGIFAQDYGQAGAIDFLGRAYGLPKALSGHQTWFLWGPRGYSGNCMIVLDDSRERLEQLWEHVEYVGTSADNPYALEKEIPIFICRGAKFGTLAQLWPEVKRWR